MTSSIETLEAQVIDLQSRLAFQEDALQDLSAQMATQAQELLLARQHIQLLNQKLNDLFLQLEQKAAGTLQERPPHY
jgi:SlyX protein